MFNRRRLLPTTLDDFDLLVASVVKRYKLKDAHHAAAIISVAIRHLPNDQAYVTLDYLGQCVMKNLANYIADHKANNMRHEDKVNQLAQMLLTDPNNFQVRDELQKAANEGSKSAQAAIAKFEAEKVEEPATAG